MTSTPKPPSHIFLVRNCLGSPEDPSSHTPVSIFSKWLTSTNSFDHFSPARNYTFCGPGIPPGASVFGRQSLISGLPFLTLHGSVPFHVIGVEWGVCVFGVNTYNLTLPPTKQVKTNIFCCLSTGLANCHWRKFAGTPLAVHAPQTPFVNMVDFSTWPGPSKSHDHSLRTTVQTAKTGMTVGNKSEHPCFFNLQKVILDWSESHRRTNCQQSKFRRPSCPGWNDLPMFPSTNRTADLVEKQTNAKQTTLGLVGTIRGVEPLVYRAWA